MNDSIIQGASTVPTGQYATNANSAIGHNKAWKTSNETNASPHTTFPPRTTRPTGCNRFFDDSPNSSKKRNGPMYFRCGKQGHMRHECTNRVFCSHCKSNNHSNRACRKLTNGTPSPTNSHIPTGYHPTATLPPLLGSAPIQGTHTTAQPQPTNTTNNGLWFQNYQDTNQPRTSTTVQTPTMNNMSPASTASMTEAITQLLTHVVTNKKDDVSKQMMKNIKTFDGTDRTE